MTDSSLVGKRVSFAHKGERMTGTVLSVHPTYTRLVLVEWDTIGQLYEEPSRLTVIES